jgi:hypothetical protein
MPSFSSTAGPSPAELAELLHRIARPAQKVFERHDIVLTRAEEILYDCLVVLAFRWHRVANRERWLLEMIENRCRDGASLATPVER